MHGFAGDFCLAAGLEGHPAGTLVPVSVSARDRSRLVLHFSDHHEVQADACVLLCGSVGELVLLELGYGGPLVRRPRLAAGERARRYGDLVLAGASAARAETEGVGRT